MDFSWLANPLYLHYLWTGLVNTILMVAVSGVLGFALAVVVGVLLVRGSRPVVWLLHIYCTVIRGTPLLLQLFIFYNALGLFLAQYRWIRESFPWPMLSSPFFYGALTFIVSVGAYSGVVIRGALRSVPSGEIEAGLAFGLTDFQIRRRLWLPRAIQICLPALTNEGILLLKSVPLVSTIAVMDLLGAADIIRDSTYEVYPPLLVITACYLILAGLMTLAVRLVERNFPGQHARS